MAGIQLFLLILQVIIAAFLIILVLLQKSDGDSLTGIGGGSGGMNSVISVRASANILTKTTMTLVAIFMLNCLILAAISNKSGTSTSKINDTAKQELETNSGKKSNSDGKSKLPTAPNIPSVPRIPTVPN